MTRWTTADIQSKGLKVRGLETSPKPWVVIGIDTGTNTGFAAWDTRIRALLTVETLKIHRAMELIKSDWREYQGQILVRVEDARQRKFFGNTGREKLQGAGSVKRDAAIWEDFLADLKIPFQMVAPKNNTTKVNAEYFRKITGWQGRTSEHARDAAMLCWGRC